MGNWVKFSYVNLRKQAQPADKHCGLCCHAASSDSSLSLWLLDGSRCHYMKCFYGSLWHIEGRLAETSINISDCVAQLTSTFFPFNTKWTSLMFYTIIWEMMKKILPWLLLPGSGNQHNKHWYHQYQYWVLIPALSIQLVLLKYVPIPWHRN